MASRNYHILTDGSVAHSLNTSTVSILLASMLHNVNAVKENEQEQPIEASKKIKVHKLKVGDLSWQLASAPFDHTAVSEVDADDIVKVKDIGGAYKIVEGLEVLHKAFSTGKKSLNCVIVAG